MMTIWWILLFIFGIIIALVLVAVKLRGRISHSKFTDRPLGSGNIKVPELRSVRWNRTSPITSSLIRSWSEKPIPDWKREGKVNAPRVLLAKLHDGKAIDVVDDYLLSLKPWGKTGSTWPLRPDGDYDFTLVPLTSMLFLLGGTIFRTRLWKPFLFLFLVKMFTDFLFLFPVTKYYRSARILIYFLPLQMLHFIYVNFIGIAGNLLPVSWKRRKIKL